MLDVYEARRCVRSLPAARCTRRTLRAALVLTLGVASAAAQDAPLSANARTALERAALARAHGEAWSAVCGLEVKSGQSLGDWLTADAQRERALRRWMRAQPRAGAFRHYSDGAAEADVRISPADLAAAIAELPESAGGGALPRAEVARAARNSTVIWATGAASRDDLTEGDRPAGWENVSREGVEIAKRAAIADATHALLDAVCALKVTNAWRVGEFVDSSPELRDAVAAGIEKAARFGVTEYAADQVAEVEARLSMRDLIRILSEAHQQHYEGERFHAADFREMALLASQDTFTARGLAPPPARYLLSDRYQLIEVDAPPWVRDSLRGEGRYVPREGDGLSPADRVEFARLAAQEKLAERVGALPLNAALTVGELLAYDPSLKDDVTLFLNATRVVGESQADAAGEVVVKVELPLRRLWWIVRRGARQVEVEPPPSGGPAP